jgi:hypothetical protein
LKSDIGGGFEIQLFGITFFLLASTIPIIWIPIGICICQINPLAYGQNSSAIPTPSSFSPTLSSPVPFPRQEVNTGIHDGIQVSQNFSVLGDSQYTRSRPNYINPLDNATDIQMITYFNMDRKTLNATLWLGGEVEIDPGKFGAETVVYGLLVDSDNNEDTGKYGVDFQKELQWNSGLGSWNTLFVEYSSPEHNRTISIESNSTEFFGEDQKYVLIPLEINSITSPGYFRVLYYTVVIYTNDSDQKSTNTYSAKESVGNNASKMLIDLSSWIDIPPPTYSFSTTPSNIEIVRGEEQGIGLQLVSSSGILPDSVSFLPVKNSSNISIEQTSNEKLNETSSGISPASFRIRVPSDVNIGLHTIPMLVNISTGSLFPSGFIELPRINLSVPAENFASRYVNLTFSVIDPPSTAQAFKDFWVIYGTPMAILAGGFVGAFATYFIDYMRSRRERKDKKVI